MGFIVCNLQACENGGGFMMTEILPGKTKRSRWLWLTGALFLFAVLAVPAWNRNLATKSADPLNATERAWLKAHPVIRLAPDPDFPPVEYFAGNGAYSGITADYVALIEKKLGIRIEIVRLRNWDEIISRAKSRQIDAYVATGTPQRAEYLLFTQHFLEFPAVIIVREKAGGPLSMEKLHGMKVSVVSEYAAHNFIAYNYPRLSLDLAPDVETGLERVSFGLSDAFVENLATATYFIEKKGITNLRIAGDSGYVYRMGFCTRKDWPELNRILDKGLALISADEKKAIYKKWIPVEPLSFFAGRAFRIGILGAVAAILMIVAGIIAWNRALSRQVRLRTAELENELAERKRAEEALRESEEKFRVLAETIPAAIVVHQGEEMVYLNPMAIRAIGYAEREYVHMKFWDLAHGDFRELVKERGLARQRGEDVPSRYEYKWVTKDGEVKWALLSGARIEYRGKPAGIATLIDITDRKQMEEELRIARDELEKRVEERTAELAETVQKLRFTQFAVDRSSDQAFWLTSDGRIFYVNDAACDSLGYSRDELVTMSVPEINSTCSRDEFPAYWRVLQEHGKDFFETCHRAKDGRVFPVEIRCNLLMFDGKEYCCCFVTDITERKRAEDVLRESETRLKIAMDLAGLVQWEYDVESGMFTFDDQFYTMYGTTAEREGGTLMSEEEYARKFISTEESSVVAAGIAELLANARFQTEHRIIRADGEERIIVVHGEAVRDQAGCIVKLRGANQDITERKLMEEQLRKSELTQRKLACQLAQKNNFLRTLINAIPDLIFYKDCNRAYLGCNRAFEAFAGRPEQDLVGRTDLEIFSRDVADAFRKMDLAVLTTEESRRNGEWIDYPDGRRVFLETLKTPFFDLDGEILGVVGVSRDITEQKRAIAELEMTQFLVDKASIGVHRISEEGNILYANEYTCRTLGYTPEELCSMTVFDIDPTFSHEKFREHRETTQAAGSRTFESLHRRKDGSTFPVEITVNYLESQGNELSFNVSFAKEITERKRAEEALRESEARVRRKLESILDPEGETGELDLADILDAPQIQALMDDLYRITGLKMSIIDLMGRVLVDVGWQDICLKFHRSHPETLKRCHESDTDLTVGVQQGEFKMYRCKNTMWHIVTPIIVGGRHMGNLFLGQFFFVDEQIDYDLFSSQARKYGFPEEEYMAALEAVPRISEELVNLGKAIFLRLTDMFSKLSYANIKLAHSLAERDRLTATLREASLVMENSPAVLFRWKGDDEWPVELVSGNIIQFGYTPEDFLSGAITYSEIIHPDDLERVTGEVHDFCDEGADQFRLEYRIITKNGGLRWVNEHTHVERDAAGGVSTFEGIVIDVTERRLAEDSIRESRGKYQAIVDSFDGLIYICSQDYRIEFMNRMLIERTGGDAVGEYCYKVMNDLDYVCPWCVNDRVFAGETIHREMYSPKDNRWYYAVNVPIRHANGSMSKHSMLFDITNRKLSEEEQKRQKQLLEELNDTLEKRVTEEVAHNREKDIMLIQQNRQAALGEMLDHIAHQWKQPLTSISLIVQELEETSSYGELTDKVVEETVGKTIALVQHMAQTIDTFRGFYRPDKEKTVFTIKDSIDQALAFIAPAFRFHSIAVELDVDPGLTAFGYPKEYAQVLLNILANARDIFMARGTEKARVILRAFAEDNKAVVTIEDNGGGIPETIKDRIFDFYFTTNEADGGTGIGLYMSRNIIEKNMGGTLSAENTDGGALFRIELSPT
jgi:PAS domain S-box-containing protein